MPFLFAYRALARDGSITTGAIHAESVGEARGKLAGRGLLVASVQQSATRSQPRRRLSASDLSLGLRILGDLLESGLPVGRALHAFEELAPAAWLSGLPHIQQSIREGRSLAAALDSAPFEIPQLVIGIARAGEAGTGIAAAIRRAAELTEATAELRSAIRSALAYPMIVAAAGVMAVTILITVVLPRFARILADLGQALPASTQFVLRGAALARTLIVPAVLASLALVGLWKAWTATPTGLAHWHRILLHTPVLGAVRRRMSTARMAHSLSALLESGVAMTAAVTLAARASGDAEIESRMQVVRERIGSGDTLSRALEDTRAVGTTAVRLVRAGEESGRLPAMLSHAARIEQNTADQTVRTAVRMLEPILLLTFASVVALIAAALLQAIYSVRPV